MESSADQRYYASSYGRFNTADAYDASSSASDPGSWNKYSYTNGDPINLYDPYGTCGSAPTYSQSGSTFTVDVSIPCAPPVYGPGGPFGAGGAGTSEGYTGQPAFWYEDGSKKAYRNSLEAAKCEIAPDGRTIGLNAALGILGVVSFSAEIVFDYHTGNATLVFSGGFGASGAAAQVGASTGFIWGAGDSVPNYASGGNSTVSVSIPSGLGVSVTTNSGGLTGNPLQLSPTSATAVQVTYAVGLVSLLGGVSAIAQNTVKQIPLGSFIYGPAAFLANSFDTPLYAIESRCPK